MFIVATIFIGLYALRKSWELLLEWHKSWEKGGGVGEALNV